MALFGSKKEETTTNTAKTKKIRPTVVKTNNVAREITSIASQYGIKPEHLDFHLLETRTYTRFVEKGVEKEWEEIDNAELSRLDEETLLDENFQIKQVYEIEVFSRVKGGAFEEFKIAIGANATRCKIYMQIKQGSVLSHFSALKEELRDFIDRHKVRAGILIYIFDDMVDGVVSKLAAKAQIEEKIVFAQKETILVAQGIEPTKTIDGELIFHYKEKKTQIDPNYKDRGFIQSVQQEEVLIEYIKPKPGKPGRDCSGRFIPAKRPQEREDLGFEVDEKTIEIQEDEESIKFIAKENGYITIEEGRYTIKSEADIQQIAFKTTGSILVGTDSDVSITVKEKNAVKDAIGVGMRVEVTNLQVEGNVGSNAKVKAITATIGGQTHKSSVIEAHKAEVNVHKGTIKAKEVKITRLEHGKVEGEDIHVAQAIGGEIYGERVVIDVCGSYVKVFASHKIEINSLRGSENIFTIDPLQQQKAKESFRKNKETIEQIEEEIDTTTKEIDELTLIVRNNLPLFNDVKKKLLQYKKNGVKLPQAYVKQYKIYQAQIDKLKELKEHRKSLEERYDLLINQTDSLQYTIFDARVINHDKWRDYNEIRARLLDPPLEIVYKPTEYENNHVYGVVEVEEGVFKIQPLKEDI